MSKGPSPGLLDALAANQAKFRAASTEISEREQRTQQEIRDAARERREANEARCKELDEKSAAAEAAREDPNAKNEWFHRKDGGDHTMSFGPGSDELDEPAAQDTPPAAAEPPTNPATQPPARARRAPGDEDDDEDFANRSWLG
ncbi:hypothetical protein BJF85_24040 [Saccharomonospora sp. CUA-673]|uniref:hypothetical protein n=1 Tax=Saccharomonospora sp. CUA-673 TaxID=1904969 RepID=UPI000964EEC2|nr:hypothetical protein [Saccharomonospora sp. CUA-673]OLT41304.1 hypothetical protein BJF85_24040 [Saccharomonospora sp. CUA-673]